MDTELFYWINTQFQSRIMTAFMLFITESTHFVLPGILVAAYLIWTYSWKGFWFVGVITLTVIINDTFCHSVLKPLFDRPRPCKELADVILYSRCSNNGSFPSNHASNIFTLATLFAATFRSTFLFAYAMALMVGISRIYLGVHYPSDILAGAVIGITMGLLGVRFYVKLLKNSAG